MMIFAKLDTETLRRCVDGHELEVKIVVLKLKLRADVRFARQLEGAFSLHLVGRLVNAVF